MAWYNRSDVTDSTEEPSISPDTEPSMLERLRAQSWFSWAVKIAAAVFIVLIVVFGVRSIHHHLSSNDNTPKTPSAVGSGAGSKQTAQNPTNKSTDSTNTNSSNSSGSTSINPGKGPGTGSQAPTQVPNTGPGDVVAIFAASAIAAGGLHYLVSQRRADNL